MLLPLLVIQDSGWLEAKGEVAQMFPVLFDSAGAKLEGAYGKGMASGSLTLGKANDLSSLQTRLRLLMVTPGGRRPEAKRRCSSVTLGSH